MAIVMPLSVIGCLRYDVAIILPAQDSSAFNLLAVSICAAVLLSIFLAAVQPFVKHPLTRILNAPGLLSYLWCVAPLVLLRSIYSALNFWQARKKFFASISFAEIGAACGTISYQIVAAIRYLGGSSGLIFGYMFGSAVSTAILGYRFVKNCNIAAIRNMCFRELLQTVLRYRKFPLFDIWGILFNSISWQIPALMLAAFFSPATVGFYALADRIVKVPMLLVGRSISKVFLQRASAVAKQEKALADLVDNVLTILIAIGLLPALLLGLIGQEIIAVVFGETWIETGLYLQIFSLWMFVWFVSSPMSTLFIVFEKQELALIIHSAIFITRLVSFTVGGLFHNVLIALGFFAATGVIVYTILLIWCLKQAKVSFRRLLQIVGSYFLYASPFTVVLMLLKYVLHTSNLILLVAALPMVLLYYGLVYKKESVALRSLGVIRP